MIRIGIAVVATLGVAQQAHAGTCHGGSGTSGGTNTGSTSTGGTNTPVIVLDGQAARREEPGNVQHVTYVSVAGCLDDTDVLGFRKCTPYGSWARNLRLPHIIVELGTNMRQFGSTLTDRTTSVTHGAETFAYRIVMPQGHRTSETAITTDLRASIGLSRNVYVGVEGELGVLSSPAAAQTEMMSSGTFGTPQISEGTSAVMGGFGIAGVRGVMPHGSLALEMAGGVRSVMYAFDSAYHECNQSNGFTTTKGVIEGRARAEVWMGPWMTLGATLGTSAIDRGDWLAGIYLGLHSRAFGGVDDRGSQPFDATPL